MGFRSSAAASDSALRRATFVLYCLYTIDYYIRISTRVPAIAAARPTLIEFSIIVMCLLAQISQFKGRLTNRPAKALFALFAYLAVSLPFVTWPGSVLHNLDQFSRVVAFFFFTVLIVDTERKLVIFLIVFVGCQLYRVLDPLYLHITTGYLGDSTYLGGGDFEGRLSGAPFDWVNPNGLGFVTVRCVPFLYYCLYQARQLYRKILAVTLISACMYVLYLTLSRGSMIALFVIIWQIFRRTKHKVLFVTGLLAIFVIAWAHFGTVHRDRYMSLLGGHGGSQGSVQEMENRTAYGRVQLTEEEFEIGMERPIFGHGLGTTAEAKVHNGHGAQASHNLYTELLIEIGIVGAFFFLRFLYSIFLELKDLEQRVSADKVRPADDGYRRLLFALVALFWMYLVFSANYFALSQVYWYLLAGLVVVFARQAYPADVQEGTSAEGKGNLLALQTGPIHSFKRDPKRA